MYDADELIDRIRELEEVAGEFEPKENTNKFKCAYGDNDTICVKEDEDGNEYIIIETDDGDSDVDETAIYLDKEKARKFIGALMHAYNQLEE